MNERTSLGAILMEMGVIEKDKLVDAIEMQRLIREEARLGKLLVENGFCSAADVKEALLKQKKLRESDHAHGAIEVADVVIKRRRSKSMVQQQSRLMEKAEQVVKRISDEYLQVTPEMLEKGQKKK